MKLFSDNKTYPEVYISNELKKVLSAKPQIPDAPKEPEKPTVVADPGEYDSGGNRGCFLFALIVAIIGFIAIMSSDMDNKSSFIFPGIVLILCTFFLFKTTSWDKEINEKQREEHKKSLATLASRQARYEQEYSQYLKEKEEYNNIVAERNSTDYILQMRRSKLRNWLIERETPEFEDCEGEEVKKGASEAFFFEAILDGIDGNFEVYDNKKIPIYKSFYYPDILLVYENLFIDIEIDEPYAGDDGTPIHYIQEDKYGFTENIDSKRNDFMTKNGFEVIRFSEEQVFLYTDDCVAYIIDFVNSIIAAQTDVECDDKFKIRKWTKDEAAKMAYKRFRNTYVPEKYRALIGKEDHRTYEEMREEFDV